MNRIVSQRFGLGDILFLVPLIRKWQANGDKVLWPVVKEYLNIQRNFPDIEFCDATKLHINYDNRNRHQWKEYTVEPLCWSDLYKGPPANCMRAKYDLYNEDFMMWKELYWERSYEREMLLFHEVVYPHFKTNLEPGFQYNLISDRWGGLAQGQYVVPIKVDNGLPNVYLKYVEGFNLLDWAAVIENATYIHTVGSSINYMMEVLDLKAKEVHLYKRAPRERHFLYYSYLLTKSYIYHD